MSVQIEAHTINSEESISVCLEKMNLPHHLRTVFVLDAGNKLVGSISDGDIRRGFLKGLSLQNTCEAFMFKDFKSVNPETVTVDYIKLCKELGISVLPQINAEGGLTRILDLTKLKSFLPLSAVIMAGGFGNRLRPLTNETPKPMLPVGGIPILEINIKRLIQYGIDEVYIAVNYLKEKIMDYFGDGSNWGIKINYIIENEPLGTIGALHLIKNKIKHAQILLFNADILSNIDLEDMYNGFKESNADLSIASIPYKVTVPFAVFEFNQHNIIGLSEKPTYTYYSNAGFYLFQTKHLNQIPDNTFYNATDFTETLIKDGAIVTQFPILGYWSDIGSIEDYKKAQTDIQILDLN